MCSLCGVACIVYFVNCVYCVYCDKGVVFVCFSQRVLWMLVCRNRDFGCASKCECVAVMRTCLLVCVCVVHWRLCVRAHSACGARTAGVGPAHSHRGGVCRRRRVRGRWRRRPCAGVVGAPGCCRQRPRRRGGGGGGRRGRAGARGDGRTGPAWRRRGSCVSVRVRGGGRAVAGSR